MKKYIQFIKERSEFENDSEPNKDIDSSKYSEIQDEIKSMINSTIEKNGGEFDSFVDSFIKSPEDVKIEGFINDSDIYDFYLKFRNDIDELLNDNNYFDEVPSEIGVLGLYDYIIEGTKRAVNECVKLL